MRRFRLLRVALVLLLAPASALAADGWSQLKPGMTRGEAIAVLGAELVGSRGRGFEVAIYDGHAEVVFLNGQVVAWTAPALSQAAPSPAKAWQFEQTSRAHVNAQAARRVLEANAANSRPAAILPAYRL